MMNVNTSHLFRHALNPRTYGSALPALGVGLALVSAGCADRNNNGQPESLATEKEMRDGASTAAKNVENAVDKLKPAAEDTVKRVDNLGEAAMVTSKVKLALQNDGRMRGAVIDVDTLAEKNQVVLRGTVLTEGQKSVAAQLAKNNAPKHAIVNQLAVRPVPAR